MGETTNPSKGSTSGQSGQTSGKGGGTTSKKEGKLYTTADIEKIKSDAITPIGREKKAAEEKAANLERTLTTTKSRLDDLERERDESRLAEARGDPAALKIYQREQAIIRRERDVEAKETDVQTREAALKTERESIDGDKHKVNLAYIAAKHGIDQDELEGLGIRDAEALEKVAEKIAAKAKGGEGKGEGEGEGEGGEGAEGAEYQPDSGEGAGGKTKALTTEAVEEMSMADVDQALSKAKEPPK